MKKICGKVVAVCRRGGAVVAGSVVAFQAKAASLLPADVLDTVIVDTVDTAEDVSTQLIPVVVGVTVAFAILGMIKRGLGKSGVR